MDKKIKILKTIIDSSQRIVFFGGAGVSTESGIPDFRSTDGLYNQQYKYPPETILSRTFFDKYPEEFFKFYREKMICQSAKPNFAHEYLAKLEKEGKLSGIVTQNIDNLHFLAGSKNVFELHGNVYRNYCMNCNEAYGIDVVANYNNEKEIPLCNCGGVIKPDVVLYEEGLSGEVIEGAIDLISNADMLIVAGTSLAVYPAASFINYFKGDKLVVVNKSDISVDADLVINDSVGAVLKMVSECK